MTGLLGLTLPSWLPLVGYGVAAIAIASGGAYVDHKFMAGAVATEKLHTAAVQSLYDGYKSKVISDIAQANAAAERAQERLSKTISDLQDQLAKQQQVADAKSAQLKAILDKASPQDVRPIGPVASNYYGMLNKAP